MYVSNSRRNETLKSFSFKLDWSICRWQENTYFAKRLRMEMMGKKNFKLKDIAEFAVSLLSFSFVRSKKRSILLRRGGRTFFRWLFGNLMENWDLNFKRQNFWIICGGPMRPSDFHPLRGKICETNEGFGWLLALITKGVEFKK